MEEEQAAKSIGSEAEPSEFPCLELPVEEWESHCPKLPAEELEWVVESEWPRAA